MLKGECFLMNFADDFVAGFQYKSEAEWYYLAMKERMEQFNLELESRLIEFGRFAETNRLSREKRNHKRAKCKACRSLSLLWSNMEL